MGNTSVDILLNTKFLHKLSQYLLTEAFKPVSGA